ncbi:MAG: hypothetical protein AAF623_09495 [Planctomycetota bacterium]
MRKFKLLFLSTIIFTVIPFSVAAQFSGLRLMDQFKAAKVANNQIAPNCYSISVRQSDGATFISGPGYIRVLVDQNGDQVFDSFQTFAKFPKTGVQGGLEFVGKEIFFTGDGGLWSLTDRNNDGLADGPGKQWMEMKTGGEHDAHSVRVGPDGWFWVLAGNGVPIRNEYFSGLNTPVRDPQAGFLMRVSPDFKQKEIFCHGFRNAYDFDFNSLGQVFVYDSDGERDISLPWYQPTRVFEMTAGDHAGWVSRGWKRPGYFPDMPKVIAKLGRGSPTGVVCCQSKSFPNKFRDALFVADWTFGRVMVILKEPDTGRYSSPIPFAVTEDQFGFAVTDLDFAADGSLLISVGGRGTEGAIYRISFIGNESGMKAEEVVSDSNELDQFQKLINSKRLSEKDILAALNRPSPEIKRYAIQALVGRKDILWRDHQIDGPLNSNVIEAVKELIPQSTNREIFKIYKVIEELDPLVVESLIDDQDLPIDLRALCALKTFKTGDRRISDRFCEVVSNSLSVDNMGHEDQVARYARSLQWMLGKCDGELDKQMFAGYSPRTPLFFDSTQESALANQISQIILKSVQIGNRQVAREFGRVAAMLQISDDVVKETIVRQVIDETNDVSQQIHWMICLSQVLGNSGDGLVSKKLAEPVAKAILEIPVRLKQQNRNTDRNFIPRMKELVSRLVEKGGVVFENQLSSFMDGTPSNLYLLSLLSETAQRKVVTRITQEIRRNPDATTAEQLQAIHSFGGPAYHPILRQFRNQKQFQPILASALSRSPLPEDREFFIQGLEAPNLTTVKNSAVGLRRSFQFYDPQVVVEAYFAAQRLGWDRPSISVRDQLFLLVERHLNDAFDYRMGQQIQQQSAVENLGQWLKVELPDEFKRANQRSRFGSRNELPTGIEWDSGDRLKGELIYNKLQCAQCHNGGARLGPRLEGVSKRFNRNDLYQAIVNPNLQVADRYRAIVIETVDGQVFRGSRVYESVDGITLQQADGTTVRINRSNIDYQKLSTKSLMPEGLLDNTSPAELADLFSYLSGL